jgi:hypothetical protein
MLKGAAVFLSGAGLLALPKLAKAKLSDPEIVMGLDTNTGEVTEVDFQVGLGEPRKDGWYAWEERGFSPPVQPEILEWPIVAKGWTPFSFYQYDPEEGNDCVDHHIIDRNGDDSVFCPMGHYGTTLDWLPDYYEHKHVSRIGIESIQNKLYEDQWQTALAAGTERNIVVFDQENKDLGRLSSRLVALMKTVMRRNGRSSPNGRMTDLVIGTKAFKHTFDVDPFTCVSLFGVNVRHMPELDKGGDLAWWYDKQLHGKFPTHNCTTGNLAIGIDMQNARENFQSWVPLGHGLTERRFPPYVANEEDGIKPDERNSSRFTTRCGHIILDNRQVLLGAF